MLIQLITLQVVIGKNRMFGLTFCIVSILVCSIFLLYKLCIYMFVHYIFLFDILSNEATVITIGFMSFNFPDELCICPK